MTDAEFEEWKIKLIKGCPWFKKQEQKYVDGESDEAFPFTKTMEEMKAKKMEMWGGKMGGMMNKGMQWGQWGKQHGEHDKGMWGQWGQWGQGQGEGKQFDFGSMMEKFKGPSEAYKSYEAGTMTDAEFEEWKIKLIKGCPWFKKQEQKYVDGESNEAFPFTKTMEEMKAKKMEMWGGKMGGMMSKWGQGKQFEFGSMMEKFGQ